MDTRTDVHRPSAIQPEDYREVGIWTMNIQGFGDAEFMQREREICRKDMERTGGKLQHFSNGACDICGNVLAIYLVLFHHAKTNVYITVGVDCAAKLSMSFNEQKMNLFRRQLQDAREAQAGRKKAIALLSDYGLSEAWDIFVEPYPTIEPGSGHDGTNCVLCFGVCRNQYHQPEALKNYNRFEERTIRDIVSKLVKYGSISEKQQDFVRLLLNKIQQRPIVEAQRQAEKDAAGPVPSGRTEMIGTVVMLKEVERRPYYYGDDGLQTKIMIKLSNGSKVYGNRFANVDKGQQIKFVATVQVSDKDPKFGFFKRPKLVS